MRVFALVVVVLVGSVPPAMAQVPAPGGSYGDAIRWYERAAEAGDPRAQYLLGLRLESGAGGRVDDAKAADWFGRAAAQGHAEAQFKLAVMHAEGRGVERDPAAAARLYQDAAEAGLPVAQYNLGVAYLNGAGVERDIAEAFGWIAVAANAGVDRAADLRDRLDDVLTGELRAEALERAAEIRSANPIR